MNLGENILKINTVAEDKVKKTQAGVFRVLNVMNGRAYYACTRDMKTSMRTVRNKLRNHTHGNPILQEHWMIFGGDSFVFEVVRETVDESEAKRIKEQMLQNFLKKDPCHIYNIGVSLK